MSDAVSPYLRRRRLGSEARKLREARQLSATAVAKKIGTSQTKLSGVENARRKFTDEQLELLIAALNEKREVPAAKAEELRVLHQESDQLGWPEQYSDVLPDNIEMLAGFEEGAAWVREYSEAFVPILLQKEKYAHAVVASASPYQRSADMPRIVEFRQKRTLKLNDRSFRYTVIINEGALWRHVGGLECMKDQLQYLLDAKFAATVELHILPFEAGEHPAQGKAFSLITFPEPEDPEMVFVDNGAASVFLESQPEIRRHTSVFGGSMSNVLDLDDSRARIENILARIG